MSKKWIAVIIIGLVIVVGLVWPASNPQIQDKVITEETQVSSASAQMATDSAKLQIEDIKVGTGPEVTSGDTVVMHYKGTLENGTQFDSSYDRGTPFETRIGVGAVIDGWEMGIPGMKVGGKRKLVIPPVLGYGSTDMGVIPPNSTLVFEVELLEIK